MSFGSTWENWKYKIQDRESNAGKYLHQKRLN